ncbi:MAG: hypothetical protein NXI16_03245 [Alphaproteobacteria bacterium]|nr:hypothetical protein [Alphaproteobacteria bacterium]
MLSTFISNRVLLILWAVMVLTLSCLGADAHAADLTSFLWPSFLWPSLL